MLAENTGIDARTRWREAVQLLQDDVRYTDVEDGPEREDLFNDFVSELEKKEREDRSKQKSSAIRFLNNFLTDEKANGSITRKSTWAEFRDNYLKKPEVRALDDMEVKRIFQDHVGKLDFLYKEEERCRKVELQRKIDILSDNFRELLEKLAVEGIINARSRWQDCCLKKEICDSIIFKELDSLLSPDRNSNPDNDKDEDKDKDKSRKSANSFTFSTTLSTSASNSSNGGGDSSSSNGNSASGCIGSVRDTFDRVLVLIREAARADKRLILEVLKDWQYELKHNSPFTEFQDVVYIAAGIKLKVSTEVAANVAITEDGEELEENVEDRTKSGFGKQLRYMLAKRPFALEGAYRELIDEEMRRYKKKEERFILLLEGYYAEHSFDSWDETKRNLSRHSDFLGLEKKDRETLYASFSLKKSELKSKKIHETKVDEKSDKTEKYVKGGRERDRTDVRKDGITEIAKVSNEKDNEKSKKEVVKERKDNEERTRKLSEGEILCENETIFHSNRTITADIADSHGVNSTVNSTGNVDVLGVICSSSNMRNTHKLQSDEKSYLTEIELPVGKDNKRIRNDEKAEEKNEEDGEEPEEVSTNGGEIKAHDIPKRQRIEDIDVHATLP